MLERTKETKVQYGLKLKDRRENVKEAFIVNPKYLSTSLRTSSIFLIDDILTSDSTLLEAARILKKNGAKKLGINFGKRLVWLNLRFFPKLKLGKVMGSIF